MAWQKFDTGERFAREDQTRALAYLKLAYRPWLVLC